MLDSASFLGLGFRPPKCGWARNGPGNAAAMKKRERDTERRAVEMVELAFAHHQALEEIAIGGKVFAKGESKKKWVRQGGYGNEESEEEE